MLFYMLFEKGAITYLYMAWIFYDGTGISAYAIRCFANRI